MKRFPKLNLLKFSSMSPYVLILIIGYILFMVGVLFILMYQMYLYNVSEVVHNQGPTHVFVSANEKVLNEIQGSLMNLNDTHQGTLRNFIEIKEELKEMNNNLSHLNQEINEFSSLFKKVSEDKLSLEQELITIHKEAKDRYISDQKIIDRKMRILNYSYMICTIFTFILVYKGY